MRNGGRDYTTDLRASTKRRHLRTIDRLFPGGGLHTYTCRRLIIHSFAVTDHHTNADTNAIRDAGRNGYTTFKRHPGDIGYCDTDRNSQRYPYPDSFRLRFTAARPDVRARLCLP